MIGRHRRPAEVRGNRFRDRIGQVRNVRQLVGLVLLAVGGTGMFVLELVAAIGDPSGRPLAIVLAAGTALCLLGAVLRGPNGEQWFFGVLSFAFNAAGAYAFDSALYERSFVDAFLLIPGLLLFSAGTALMLALDEPDFGHFGLR